MSHIASEVFYQQVQDNIRNAKNAGYVLFYEWVTEGTPENNAKFREVLWLDISPELYTNLSKLYGISAQNNADFLWIVNNKDFNIDISIDEVIEIYEQKFWPIVLDTSAEQQDIPNVNDDVVSLLASLNSRELTMVRHINQAILNFMMKHDALRDSMVKNFGKADIFWVILDDRNEHIVNGIHTSDERHIYVMYGLMHFEWIYELLLQDNSGWKIMNTQEFQVIHPAK